MLIQKINIKGFGNIRDLTVEFSRGLNIVLGANESGKTTIQAFVKAILFGLKGGRAGKDGVPSPLKRYKPWNVPEYGGSIEYRLDNGDYYRVERDFNENSVRIFDSQFKDVTGSFRISRESGPEFWEKHLGLNEDCFERTVFIRQMESRTGVGGTGGLLERLANIRDTGFEDVSLVKAQDALKEALKSYIGTDKTTVRPLDKLSARLGELKALKHKLEEKRAEFYKFNKELIEAYDNRNKLEKRKKDMHMIGELIDFKGVITKAANHETLLKDIQERLSKAGIERKKAVFGFLSAVSVFLLLLFLYLVTGMRISRSFSPVVMLILISIISLIPLAALLIRMLKAFGIVSNLQVLYEEINKYSGGNISGEIRGTDQKIGSQEQDSGSRNKDSGSSNRDSGSLNRDSGSWGEGNTSRSAGSNSQSERTRKSYLAQLETLLEVGREMDPDLAAMCAKFDETSIDDLRTMFDRSYEQTNDNLVELLLNIREYETLIKSMAPEGDELLRVEEEIAELENKKIKLEETAFSLRVALEVLNEAGQELQKDFVPVLNNKMSGIMQKITGDRYKELRTDPELRIRTIAPETGDVVAVSLLSGGTADQAYLALRFALAETISLNGEKLPFLLDETFSQYDDDRTREAFSLLRNCYGGSQVILFTCKEHEAELAKEIFEELNIIKMNHKTDARKN